MRIAILVLVIVNLVISILKLVEQRKSRGRE